MTSPREAWERMYMGRKPIEAPAFFSLIVFLGTNYGIGYAVGHVVTGSAIGAAIIALATPCLSLLGFAFFSARPEPDKKTLDEA
jgi:hypothetical protein